MKPSPKCRPQDCESCGSYSMCEEPLTELSTEFYAMEVQFSAYTVQEANNLAIEVEHLVNKLNIEFEDLIRDWDDSTEDEEEEEDPS